MGFSRTVGPEIQNARATRHPGRDVPANAQGMLGIKRRAGSCWRSEHAESISGRAAAGGLHPGHLVGSSSERLARANDGACQRASEVGRPKRPASRSGAKIDHCANLRDRPARSLEHRATIGALRATAYRIQLLQAEADQLQAERTVRVSAVAQWRLDAMPVS
jgi:hypothetical protein